MSSANSGLTIVQYSYQARDSRASNRPTPQSRFRSTVRGRPRSSSSGESAVRSQSVVVRLFASEPSGLYIGITWTVNSSRIRR